MKWNKIIILMVLIMGFSNLVNGGYCYQESANVSNQTGIDGNCNLIYTGNYSIQAGDTGWVNANNTYDGSYTTFGTSVAGGSGIDLYYIKPIGALNTSLWSVRGNSTSIVNLTIPQNCWNYSNTFLKLKYVVRNALVKAEVSCYFNSTDSTLLSTTTPKVFYEEGMYWDINSCYYSGLGNWLIQASDNCNITSNVALGNNNLTINGTGTTTITANITGWRNIWLNGVTALGNKVICKNGGCFH